jgi:hypothetical protein
MVGGTISGPRIDGLALSGNRGITGEDAEAVRIEKGGAAVGPDQPGWVGAACMER